MSIHDAFYELYKIKSFLDNKKLHFLPLMIHAGLQIFLFKEGEHVMQDYRAGRPVFIESGLNHRGNGVVIHLVDDEHTAGGLSEQPCHAVLQFSVGAAFSGGNTEGVNDSREVGHTQTTFRSTANVKALEIVFTGLGDTSVAIVGENHQFYRDIVVLDRLQFLKSHSGSLSCV